MHQRHDEPDDRISECVRWPRWVERKWNQENIMKENSKDEKFYSVAHHISIFFSAVDDNVTCYTLAQSLLLFLFRLQLTQVCMCFCVVHRLDCGTVCTGAVSVISEIKFSVNMCSLTHIQIYLVALPPPPLPVSHHTNKATKRSRPIQPS